jgi:hypothetical protein
VSDSCDQAAATTCVDTYIQQLVQGNPDLATRDTCVTAAGCTTNWDAMTDVEQQALAAKYNTSVSTIEQAYQNLWDTTQTELEDAMEDH